MVPSGVNARAVGDYGLYDVGRNYLSLRVLVVKVLARYFFGDYQSPLFRFPYYYSYGYRS